MTSQTANLELFLSGVWTTVPLYASAGCTVTRGMDAGAQWPSPSRIECEINNDSLNYDPSRATATLYGIAGRNTRARITLNTLQRLWAEASEYKPDRTVEHQPGTGRGRSWVKLTAEGVLRRLGSWEEPLRSPMYRTISKRTTSVGHWSLEDDKDAVRVANSLGTGQTATIKGGAVLGESEGPDGAGTTAKITAGSTISGRFAAASATAGWQVGFSFKMPAVPASATYGALLRWNTSNLNMWLVEVNNTTYRFSVTAYDGTVLWSSTSLFGSGVEPNVWVTFRMRAVQSGGNVDVQPSWYAQGTATSFGITDLFAGGVGALRSFAQVGDTVMTGTWFSHIFGVTTVADSLTGATAQKVFNGYRGEQAGVRFNRVLAEQGINRYNIGTSTTSQPMGPQRPDTLIALLKEIRDTEDAIIVDERFDIGLTMTMRRDLYVRPVKLALTYPTNVMPPFAKIIGDRDTRNRVTAKNRDGAEVTAELLSGPMSVQPPPAGVGEAKGSVDVNVADEIEQLDDIASWHRAKGTLERPRYDQVSIDLLANPGLLATAELVREGDMISVTGFEPDPIYLLVTGFVDTTGLVERTITFKTEPYEPYMVGIYDNAAFRWDAGYSTLAAGASNVATSFSLTTPEKNDVWSTTPGYQLMVGGERVTVTAMTAAAGTGPYTQTATVTRSVNGVVKAQLINTAVRLADGKRWGL